MKKGLRNALVGFGGGGLAGAAIWGATRLFQIEPLLAWIIAGAAAGGFEAIAWTIGNRRSKSSRIEKSPPNRDISR